MAFEPGLLQSPRFTDTRQQVPFPGGAMAIANLCLIRVYVRLPRLSRPDIDAEEVGGKWLEPIACPVGKLIRLWTLCPKLQR